MKIILREFLGLADLFGAQILYINKLIKVIIFYKNEYFMLATFKKMMPYLKSFDNCWKFSILDLISSLCKNNFSPKKYYQILLIQINVNNYFIDLITDADEFNISLIT